MFSSFKSLYSSGTGKDTIIVFIGTIINVVIGGLFFVLAPRLLGPQDYGIFATVISTAILLITIANFGIDTGMLRFARKGTKGLNDILSLSFKAYIVLGLIVACLGFILSPLLSQLIKIESATNLLRIAFSGSIFILLTNYFVAALQVNGRFLTASLVNIAGNFTRLIVLVLSLLFFKYDLFWVTIIFFITPIASVVFGLITSPVKLQHTTTKDAWNFFKFNYWIAFALIISSIPFDNYLLIKFAGPFQTGIYAAPFKILTFAYMFGGNYTRVLANRFASFDTNAKASSYALKALAIPAMVAVIILLLIIFAPIIINLLFGQEFQSSVSIYQILSVGFAAFFMSTVPSSIIIYYFGKSNISFAITIVKYFIFIMLMLFLVPKYAAVGAAFSFSFAEFTSVILMSVYSFYKLR